jgi:hypothetical protein
LLHAVTLGKIEKRLPVNRAPQKGMEALISFRYKL